jgi:hypothetical protein
VCDALSFLSLDHFSVGAKELFNPCSCVCDDLKTTKRVGSVQIQRRKGGAFVSKNSFHHGFLSLAAVQRKKNLKSK